MPKQHVENVFRHGYGVLVASLIKRFGINNLSTIEDAVQQAMMKALEHWTRSVIPDNPEAWLYKVAYRELISEFRRQKQTDHKTDVIGNHHDQDLATDPNVPLKNEMDDSLLRMLFVSCHPDLPDDSKLVFTLKSISGFSVEEISTRLYISKENVYKRYTRARKALSSYSLDYDVLSISEVQARLPSVQSVLYLMFTEGYFSSHNNVTIKRELCEEAIRYVQLLCKQQTICQPQTKALLALMYLHLARFDARQNDMGVIVLLEQQDRTRWDQNMIALGIHLLQDSAEGDSISRYHIEASIAAEHCMSPEYVLTRWDKIVNSYELLNRFPVSPIHYLNHAIALSEWRGAENGLALLQQNKLPQWLTSSYIYHAVKSYLLLKIGEKSEAAIYATKAYDLAPSDSIRQLLITRLSNRC